MTEPTNEARDVSDAAFCEWHNSRNGFDPAGDPYAATEIIKTALDKARAEGVAAVTAWLRKQDGHGEWREAADAIDAEFLTPTQETTDAN